MTLTDNEESVLRYIAQHIDKWGFQPSYREICDHFGWSSAAYCTSLIDSLENKGVVARHGGRSVMFEWRSFLRDQNHDAERTDGPHPRCVPRRNLRRDRRGRSDRLHGGTHTPRRGLARRKPARASR